MKELTEGEFKIVKALKRLENLWEKEGKDLLLFNGNCLRRISKSTSIDGEIMNFPKIKGDGGDGGDSF